MELHDPSRLHADIQLGYRTHHELTFPARDILQATVNGYLTQFSAMEVARAKALKQARSVPDDDGFITVTKGGRAGPAKLEEAQAAAEKLKERQKPPKDFYRFQTREKKKEDAERLKREFQEDRKRVERMRARRGKIRVRFRFSTMLAGEPMLTRATARELNATSKFYRMLAMKYYQSTFSWAFRLHQLLSKSYRQQFATITGRPRSPTVGRKKCHIVSGCARPRDPRGATTAVLYWAQAVRIGGSEGGVSCCVEDAHLDFEILKTVARSLN